jgi:hypothetical protein
VTKPRPAEFKWRQFEPPLILLAVGWYLRFSLSYRDVEELAGARHVRGPRRSLAMGSALVRHYNHGRVHMSLGPGIPAPIHPSPLQTEHRHQLPQGHRVRRKAVLGGPHHEYWLEEVAA